MLDAVGRVGAHLYHGRAWNGSSARVVSSEGDTVTGIGTAADRFVARSVLLDVGLALGRDGELPEAFPITAQHLDDTASSQGAEVERGDVVLVRTGRLTRAGREGSGDYAGGRSPGLSFTTAEWIHAAPVAAMATDTWGFEVRPNEFDEAFQPLHQVLIPPRGALPRRDVGPRRPGCRVCGPGPVDIPAGHGTWSR